ncbi:DnaJ domain-containing protein [Paenibacillus koleovorans]|uniref:DnaJ domain-containing protein n=1 Tax=Paenibacillus koleovorans TaxID=121608 RepID=UPI000FD79AAA|nr:DnaJ domain-containing protein [Paenibacillus koleovorans]
MSPAKGRRSRKLMLENYYKILELRANAPQDAIKKKYIELIKKHTPESDPEKFQEIRRAFEALRDPAKRREYDMLRKYGDSVHKLYKEAMSLVERERWSEAEQLLERALVLSPSSSALHLGLAHIYIGRGQLDLFEERMEIMLQTASSPEEKANAATWRAKLFLDNGMPEKALLALEAIKEDDRNHIADYNAFLVQTYRSLNRYEDAWNLMNANIPPAGMEQANDIYSFITWVQAFMELEKWSQWHKIQTRFRKFLKSIHDPDDRLMVVTVLNEEYEHQIKLMHLQRAEVFADFAYEMDPRDKRLQQQRKKAQEWSRLDKEMERMHRDKDTLPLIAVQAAIWYYEELEREDLAAQARNSVPPRLLLEMEAQPERFAAGIRKLPARYPLLYRRYQDQWEALYTEKTSGLNKEAQRQLR